MAISAMVFGSVLLVGGTAMAQTGYPPGTSTLPPTCTHGDVDAGTVTVGQTVTFKLCGPFVPGSTENLTVDGHAAGTKIADPDGSVTVIITVNSQSSGTLNDPLNVAIVCGTNKVPATGPGATGGTATSTGTFNLLCASTTSTSSGLPLTGANILKALLVALALIGLGVVLVTIQRRRRNAL